MSVQYLIKIIKKSPDMKESCSTRVTDKRTSRVLQGVKKEEHFYTLLKTLLLKIFHCRISIKILCGFATLYD